MPNKATIVLITMLSGTLSAASLSRAAVARILRRDLRNHSMVRPRILLTPRTVNRYTTRSQAARELKSGIAPNRHMTPNARPGHTLTAPKAQARYGLLKTPEVRETFRLPKGTLLRHNKAVCAGRGIGEITSPKAVPQTAIRKVTPLKR